MIINKKNILIFGTGSFAELVSFYIEYDTDYRVSAYVVTDDYFNNQAKESTHGFIVNLLNDHESS